MHTSNTRPQIGDMLRRICGTLGVVGHIGEGHIMQVHLLHSPKFDTSMDSIMHVPIELIGVTWSICA